MNKHRRPVLPLACAPSCSCSLLLMLPLACAPSRLCSLLLMLPLACAPTRLCSLLLMLPLTCALILSSIRPHNGCGPWSSSLPAAAECSSSHGLIALRFPGWHWGTTVLQYRQRQPKVITALCSGALRQREEGDLLHAVRGNPPFLGSLSGNKLRWSSARYAGRDTKDLAWVAVSPQRDLDRCKDGESGKKPSWGDC